MKILKKTKKIFISFCYPGVKHEFKIILAKVTLSPNANADAIVFHRESFIDENYAYRTVLLYERNFCTTARMVGWSFHSMTHFSLKKKNHFMSNTSNSNTPA